MLRFVLFIIHHSSFIILFGCAPTIRQVADNIVMPEQRTMDIRDPAPLPPAPIPDSPPPRTVSNPRLDTPEWPLSLDEAIHIALENAHVVRILAGVTAVPSGETIYDAAIVNTTIDQAQARFDPVLSQNNAWRRTNVPFGVFDPFNPFESLITSTPTDAYQSQLGLTKTNVLGGQWSLNWIENPTRIKVDGLPLNPENPTTVSLGYTQPLLARGRLRGQHGPDRDRPAEHGAVVFPVQGHRAGDGPRRDTRRTGIWCRRASTSGRRRFRWSSRSTPSPRPTSGTSPAWQPGGRGPGAGDLHPVQGGADRVAGERSGAGGGAAEHPRPAAGRRPADRADLRCRRASAWSPTGRR